MESRIYNSIKGMAALGFGAVVGVIIMGAGEAMNIAPFAFKSAAVYFGTAAAVASAYCLKSLSASNDGALNENEIFKGNEPLEEMPRHTAEIIYLQPR